MYLLIAMMMLFLCTCTKDEGYLSDSSRQDDLLKKANTKAAVFSVSPNDVDDTQAIKDAFAAAKEAGPGSVVKLAEGTFIIGPIEISDFYGYFQGAGKGKTIISNLPDLPCNDLWAINNVPHLMEFVSGDFTISDMTFHINDGCPCANKEANPYRETYGDMLVTVLVLTDYACDYTKNPPDLPPSNHYIKGVVKDVDFISGVLCEDGIFPYPNEENLNFNTNMTILVGAPWWVRNFNEPLSNGEITVSGCGFERCTVGPDIAQFSKNSKFIIENNYFSECLCGVYSYFNLGGQISVRNNKFQDGIWGSLYVDDDDYGVFPEITYPNQTEWQITGNTFQGSPGTVSLLLRDYRRTQYADEGSPQLFNIKGNTFISQEGGTAIYGLNNKDAKIWNNKFTGTGSIGVMIDGNEATDTWAENNNLIGNNFFGSTYTDASVYLGPYSMNCKVVGVAKDLVVDEGVNNSVIGVKAQKKGVQSGQYLQSNLKNMHEIFMRRGRL